MKLLLINVCLLVSYEYLKQKTSTRKVHASDALKCQLEIHVVLVFNSLKIYIARISKSSVIY